MHVRSLFAFTVVALLAGPMAAHAQSLQKQSSPVSSSPAGASASASALSMSAWVGYETGDLDGLQLRVDFVMPIEKLSPQIGLSFVGSIGWSYLTHSVTAYGVKTDDTANVLKFVPAARFTLPVNAQLSFYGDAGLGLYWDDVSVDVHYPAPLGTQSASDSGFGFMFRFGAGAFYEVNANTQLGASLYVDPMLGDYKDTTFTMMGGAKFRI